MYVHDELTEQIIGCAIEVHKALGPGLLEATYEKGLCLELAQSGLPFDQQLRIPIAYKGHPIGEYRPDLVVASRVLVEIKSVDRLIGLHRAQALSYMRVLKLRVGLILNFNTEVLRSGIIRLAL